MTSIGDRNDSVIDAGKCVMDFPTAWEFTRTSRIEDHDIQCSWYTHNMLCDCRVLSDEYERRQIELEQRKDGE